MITFDIDNTLSFLDDAVSRANQRMFDYAMEYYPKMSMQSPDEYELGFDVMNRIGYILMERLTNDGPCNDIGELRKQIILSFVQKAGYSISIDFDIDIMTMYLLNYSISGGKRGRRYRLQ